MNRILTVAAASFMTLVSFAAQAQTYTVLHGFNGSGAGPNTAGAANPNGPLTYLNGTLYGVTLNGGAYDKSNPQGWGAIYSVNASTGAGALIYSFVDGQNHCGQNDGLSPTTGLTPYTNNGSTVLVGTTMSGGNPLTDRGTIFSINSSGAECVLWDFGDENTTTGKTDGWYPYAGLVYDATHQVFYGTTEFGGAPWDNNQGLYGCGTIFVFNPDSPVGIPAESTIYAFPGGTGGCGPRSSLLLLNGILYGTTTGFSNDESVPSTSGTVFGFNLATGTMVNGSGTSMNHGFVGGVTVGSYPLGQLVYDQTHNVLYGTTEFGGNGWVSDNPTQSGDGTIFQVDLANGAFSVSTIYLFTGGSDGSFPLTGLVYDGVGKYYTSTSVSSSPSTGGVLLSGTLSPLSGVELHTFGQSGDGSEPDSLTFANGILYGTTFFGGGGCCGTVFKYVP